MGIAIEFCVFGLVCGGSRGIWGWLWFSCGVVHGGRDSISIFREFSSSVGGAFILGGGGGGIGAGLSFYGKHRKVSKYYETVDTKSQLTPTILIFFLDQICSNRVFPGENGNFACVHGRYFLFRTRADRHNSILMSLLLLVAETIKAIVGRYTDDTNLTIMLLQAYPYVCINIFLCLSRHIKFYPTPCLLIKCKTAFFYKILIACFFLITFQHIVAKRFWFGLSSK